MNQDFNNCLQMNQEFKIFQNFILSIFFILNENIKTKKTYF